MESSNLHHQHQLQDQLAALATYGVGNTHAWTTTPIPILNNGSFDQNTNGSLDTNPREYVRQQNDILTPCHSMIQDLGSNWSSNGGRFSSQSSHEFRAKGNEEELLSNSYPKFTEMMNIIDYHLNPATFSENEQKDHLNEDLSNDQKLLLRNFSSGCQISGLQLSGGATGDYLAGRPSRGNFSQIFPTVNISNLNQSSSSGGSSPLDINFQALDLFTSPSQPSHGHVGLFRDGLFCGLDHMQQSSHASSNSPSPSKIPAFTNGGVTEPKRRSSSFLEAKPPPQAQAQSAAKRSRFESRATCPPLKVRKEKLGDRIAALQQLVAPFGKTDTASVLMEAIGYIKFLQDQVETLSVPYMKSTHNKTSRTMKAGPIFKAGNEEAKGDLGSRGLCLVPLSYLSYVADTGGVWSPANFSATN